MSRLAKARSAVGFASNATGVNFEKWLTWAAIAGAAYVGWKVYKGATGAADAVVSGVANAYVAATAGPAIEVLGRVVLPTGQKIPLDSLAVKSDFTFTYAGVRYRVTVRRPDNDYDSVRA